MAAQTKQVNVDFSKYPELLEALDTLVGEQDSDRSKLIRNLVREAWEDRQRSERLKKTVLEPVIKGRKAGVR